MRKRRRTRKKHSFHRIVSAVSKSTACPGQVGIVADGKHLGHSVVEAGLEVGHGPVIVIGVHLHETSLLIDVVDGVVLASLVHQPTCHPRG